MKDNEQKELLIGKIKRIDLHLHTSISDGSDTLEELLERVRDTGLDLFAVSDHDGIRGSLEMPALLKAGDPAFIRGVEFSCKDELGKYHILGYGYDPKRAAIGEVVQEGHDYRVEKLAARVQFLHDAYGIKFSDEEIEELKALSNPGKPHIARLMIKHGYVKTVQEAFTEYIDKKKFRGKNVRPEDAIAGILGSGGIPVLAHPSYGSGDELILGEEMDERLRRLMDFGLQGVEAYYSGFTQKMQEQMIGFAEKYDLYVTAGSDYHGKNKMVALGDNNLESTDDAPAGLHRFLKDVEIING